MDDVAVREEPHPFSKLHRKRDHLVASNVLCRLAVAQDGTEVAFCSVVDEDVPGIAISDKSSECAHVSITKSKTKEWQK